MQIKSDEAPHSAMASEVSMRFHFPPPSAIRVLDSERVQEFVWVIAVQSRGESPLSLEFKLVELGWWVGDCDVNWGIRLMEF
ncbi:wall-associated receptor kinase-like 14 [Pyrus ussuriensis x Pyrus communis]|uniref:Wall-associated receptor kinase-like 14 n=1 Tax=Pyrus ussuriensis x Pyrus communis TaxID=2448454 RepID=A0A5N5GBA3_9ROSA|nr:wall-associated receptor kinase-like 14 [Pyrus ussuriensis x Pyrus communis]